MNYHIYKIEKNKETQEGLMSLVAPDVLGKKDEKFLAAMDENQELYGVLAFSFNNGEIQIDYLAVDSNWQFMGIGTDLLQTLVRICEDVDEIITITARYKWGRENESLISFFAEQENFWRVISHNIYTVSKTGRMNSPVYQKFINQKKLSECFFGLTSSQQRAFLHKLVEKNMYFLNDFFQQVDEYDQDLCMCSKIENEVVAAIFVKKPLGNDVRVSFLYGENDNAQIMSCMVAAARRFEKKYQEKDYNLVFEIVNDKVLKIVDYLFDSQCKVDDLVTEVWDNSVEGKR